MHCKVRRGFGSQSFETSSDTQRVFLQNPNPQRLTRFPDLWLSVRRK
jgi:hypothetical protein